MPRLTLTPRRAALASLGFVAVWRLAVWALSWGELRGAAASVDLLGWAATFLLGLVWCIWVLERAAQRIERRRRTADPSAPRRRSWNPLDPAAWFYGRGGQRLKQSFAAFAGYSVLFTALYLLVNLTWHGGVDPYELPQGGGQDLIRQSMQMKKIVKKKYVINPYSSIRFNPPPIEKVELKLAEVSQNLYSVGQGGEGGGAGFGAGTKGGKIRFIRLKHSDRSWDKNFGVGGDRNMLIEYAARTQQKVAEQTESIEVAQLAAFPAGKSPPVVYVAGGQQFTLSNSEKKILTQYLVEKHGMVFGDNLGGPGFHHHFIATMNEVTGTTPVPVPRDDRIHQRPYVLPDLPIVVAHGGTVPLGWKLDGRWVAYYHPGALSDAWRDDRAGIKKDIHELCFQLGVNIIFYSHAEYSTWLQSQK